MCGPGFGPVLRSSMKIGIVTPAPPGSSYGNRITARRWARILRKLGHRVSISQAYDGEPYDLLIALHARRSYVSIKRFHQQNAEAPIVVALTGTDLYRDIRGNQQARKSLEVATRIVALQPKALEELRQDLKDKTRVIYQSFENVSRKTRSSKTTTSNSKRGLIEPLNERWFDVCVVGHLRAVKDPFRAALAARVLPSSSRIRIFQIGGAMTLAMAARAEAEVRRNTRYQWLGEQPQSRVYRVLATSDLCVLSSRIEGGANVLSEAIVTLIPILASRIDGNVGILGPDYAGFFPVGDTNQLARLMTRAETGPAFLSELRGRIKDLAPNFNPKREQQAWADLISELHETNWAKRVAEKYGLTIKLKPC
jgi:putative glycosyltransferase (TIGR04348 family)